MNDSGKTLHDCFDCKGCICEYECAKDEERYFGKNKMKEPKKKGGDNND